jgi:formylglycine-generating enzyme required for sulfatase activity
LITPEGRRGLALQGQTETAGLPNAAVTALENHHLIRSEVRAGSRWYELSHDRLVEPIVQSNAAWEAARQTPLRTAAKRWQESGSQDLLYRGKALREAWAWLQANPDEAEPYERDFIQAAQQAEQARTRTRAWRVVTFAALAILVLVLSVQPVQRLWLRWRAQALGELVWIDSSQTILGDDDLFPTNKALPYGVYTVTAFAIEKYEVTNERYLLCVEANSCSPPNAPPSEYAATERSRYPVTSVTAQQADQFCTWIGRRLPTEAEWERAARSAEGAPWPWGQADPVTFTQVYLSYGDPRNVSVQESGQATQDRSLEGVYDLAGNAWEWTCTPYTETVYDPSDCADLNKYFPDRLVAKGGDAGGSLDAIHHTMAHHYSSRPWRPDSFGGFRCATSLER